MQAIRRESSSSTAATWRSAATPWRAAANGLPPPRWKKSSPKGALHEATRHAIPRHWLYYIAIKIVVLAVAVLAALLDAKADAICFVAKSWDYHVRVALETTEEENIASIRDSVRAARAKGREVLLDCEHFFDGYKANPAYALACAEAAYQEGARWLVLCDTNGGALPHEVEAIVGKVCKASTGHHIGIHA